MNQNKYDIKTVGEPYASWYANSLWKQIGSPNRKKKKKLHEVPPTTRVGFRICFYSAYIQKSPQLHLRWQYPPLKMAFLRSGWRPDIIKSDTFFGQHALNEPR